MDRREFLRRTAGQDGQVRELCGERLYMRYADAQRAGTTRDFLESLRRELRGVRRVRLREACWLRQDGVREQLAGIFEEFHARGGRTEED